MTQVSSEKQIVEEELDNSVLLTVLKDLMANKLAIIVENPGAKQLWAMKPNLSSAKQMTSSPRFQSQLGIFSR